MCSYNYKKLIIIYLQFNLLLSAEKEVPVSQNCKMNFIIEWTIAIAIND